MIKILLLVLFTLGGGKAQKYLSPLTNVHPEKALAFHWRIQLDQSEYFSDSSFKNLTSIQNYLFSDAVKQEADLNSNRNQCISALVDFAFDASEKKPYTFQILDSYGKPGSGILLGNVKWNGIYYECINANSTTFSAKWCSATFGKQVPSFLGATVGLSVGICVPNSCSEEYLEDSLQVMVNKTSLDIEATVNCPVQPTKWTAVDILSFSIFLLLVLLVIIGTTYDLIFICVEEGKSKLLSVNGDGIVESDYVFKEPHQSVLSKVAISFSIYTNTKALLDTTRKPGQLHVLHGMRFLSITWVVLGHTYVMTAVYTENIMDLAQWYVQELSFQTVGNATFSVDTFFFISGVLVAYLGVREAAKSNGKLNILLLYLHRYIRLTPTYAFLILIVVGFFGKLSDGPNWPTFVASQKDVCDKYWWTNLLYINNLHPANTMHECFALGWYLANDMQFFLLAPFFIVLLYRKPKVGIYALVFGVFGSMLSTGVISTHYKEQPTPVGIAQLLSLVLAYDPQARGVANVGFEPNISPQDQFWSDIYSKPWCRIGVYLIGMVTGYILHTSKCQIKLNKVLVTFGWLLAIVINLSVLYGLWAHVHEITPVTVGVASFYNAVSRPLWAVGLAWVTIACSCGYGGPVNAFLSWKLFVPLSRLTYSIYLGHVLVLGGWYSSREVGVHFSNKNFAFYFLAILVASTALAYLLYMLIEMPILCLQKIMFSHRKEDPPSVEEVNSPLLVADNGSKN